MSDGFREFVETCEPHAPCYWRIRYGSKAEYKMTRQGAWEPSIATLHELTHDHEIAEFPLHPIHQLWLDQAEWSQATFGSDDERGPIGALKHLAKEAVEAQAAPDDEEEYADCLLLILDAARR